MTSEAFFDFDCHTSFRDLGIDIDGELSTGGSNATYIYGNSTSRVKGVSSQGFQYAPGNHMFSEKNKLILEDQEMVLVQNSNGEVYLVDWIDSMRNLEDGVDGVRLQYRKVSSFSSDGSPVDSQILPSVEPNSVVNIDFDCHTQFGDLGIPISASMSTAGPNATYIFNGETSRLRDGSFEGFVYIDGLYDFSLKSKLILESGEMVLVRNPNGDVYLVDWVDSLRNFEDGVDGVRLRYRNVHTAEMPTPKPEPTPEPESPPELEPDVTGGGYNVIEGNENTIHNETSVVNNFDNSSTTIVYNEVNDLSDNSVNTVDNSVNTSVEIGSIANNFNAFDMSLFPVDLSDLITGNSSGKELVTGSRQDDVIGSGKGVKTLMGDTGEDDFVFFKKDRF
jgi:hypothetical protein